MDFAKALEALEEGKMVRRGAWPINQSFIFSQVPSVVKKEIVPKMTSLPSSVKKEFENRFNDPGFQMSSIYYSDQLALVSSSNLITGYSPTVEDCFAGDWVIVKPTKTE